MKFLKDSVIIQLSPIKHLAHSDPSKKLKKIMPYERNRKRKAKEKEAISEELSNSNLVIYESKKKKNEGNIKKKSMKNEDLGLCNEGSYTLNSKTKKNNHIESKQNISFSLQEHDTKDNEYDEFIWDIENNISYNVSSDNYSLISSNLDYYSD
ncbi:hypothetical protein PNEG_00836 [Pneumocystis murina B123]|uniref:Uncharacterized protein n=1 Tax=Pneumocystis murina (strain B123) TaxID=1069680 RepID=M7P9Z0_PNEMU|nr:hypothetical protein PNEG_00836 [Pneumocystis murina B123]EMR10685.1 hypothetical protein PNEG_00836 [Pneumocystis murina B123]